MILYVCWRICVAYSHRETVCFSISTDLDRRHRKDDDNVCKLYVAYSGEPT